ncbi:MAG: diacylglycerol kinase family lipid kinase [Corynebacterium sp.]|nr:diacylglycerol kinase family lipid kinase [Corynebacterium sp.]
MRLLLIMNPKSTTQSPGLFRHIIPLLRTVPDVQLRTQFTHYPGHASELSRGLSRADYDVVIAVGGDGTVNEVINGLLGPASVNPTRRDVPTLAVIPTGSANVFVRALGLPSEPVQATEALVHVLRHGLKRTIDMGVWRDKWFAVNAGFGLDAEVIVNMDKARRRGFSATPLRYLRVTLQAWLRSRRYPPTINVWAKDGNGATKSARNLPICMVSNTNPWTFLGPLPVVTNPRNSFDVGLGIFGVRQLEGVAGALTVLQMLGANMISPIARWLAARTFVFDDAMEVQIDCGTKQRFQVDGEYVGEFTSVTLGVVPEAIEVYAPQEKIPTTPLSWIRLGLSFFDIRL